MHRRTLRLASPTLALAALTAGADVAISDQPMLGEAAPTFSLPDVNGGTVNLADLRGRFVVVHFGASW